MRVSEIYLSVQGEGPRVGRPTVFVRMGGCNLRCPGWPCDTQHAIDPKYRKEWEKLGPLSVYRRIQDAAHGLKEYNVCFTGGEPFLQPKSELDELIEMLITGDNNIKFVEAFSNGTVEYSSFAIRAVCFVMDYKLPGSGEYLKGEMERYNNIKRLNFKDVIKFTIANREDYEVAKSQAKVIHTSINDRPSFYYGAVWGQLENSELIGWVLEDGLDWSFTMQVHNYVWDRTKRGI